MKPRAVLFDVDGTLISLDVVVVSLQDCCRKFGVRILSRKEIMEKAMGYRLCEFLPKLLPGVDVDSFRNCFAKSQIMNLKRYGKLLPKTNSTMRFLRKEKIKVGIVTTKSRKEALPVLRTHRITYDVLVSGSDAKKRKPDPEPIFAACKKLRIMPNDCVFVGDHAFDMEAAVAAGCVPVGTLTGWGNRKNLKASGAKYLIRDLSGLRKIIEG